MYKTNLAIIGEFDKYMIDFGLRMHDTHLIGKFLEVNIEWKEPTPSVMLLNSYQKREKRINVKYLQTQSVTTLTFCVKRP